jgi:hypothetical protein
MNQTSTQLEKPSVTTRAFDLDLVVTIARTLKEQLPSMPNELALQCAESIAIALYRERYLPTHDL